MPSVSGDTMQRWFLRNSIKLKIYFDKAVFLRLLLSFEYNLQAVLYALEIHQS